MAIPTDDHDILVFMAMMTMIPEKGEMELLKSWRWGECDSASADLSVRW
jgi:hypothetical protein